MFAPRKRKVERQDPTTPPPTAMPRAYNIQKNNVKLENRYPDTVGPKGYS